MRLIDAELMTARLVARIQEKKDSIVPTARLEAAIDDYICEELCMAPTVDPVKHGHWIRDDNGYDMYTYMCSECHEENDYSITIDDYYDFLKSMYYCPHCGAKMDREDDYNAID